MIIFCAALWTHYPGLSWVRQAQWGGSARRRKNRRQSPGIWGRGPEIAFALAAFPTKPWAEPLPTDPLVYRLHEIVGVYGDTLKVAVKEKLGDGILSTIDFSLAVEKIEDPNRDRVLLARNGRFLPNNSW